MKKHKRRWRLLNYPRFQFTLVALNVLLLLVVFVVFVVCQARGISQLERMGKEAQLPAGHPYFQMLEYQARELRSNMIVAFAATIGLGSLATLYVSNKLAGPISRMLGFFTRIAESGSVSERLVFRKGDFFADLPPEIHRALDGLYRANPASKQRPEE